jgi:hypothetical protein
MTYNYPAALFLPIDTPNERTGWQLVCFVLCAISLFAWHNDTSSISPKPGPNVAGAREVPVVQAIEHYDFTRSLRIFSCSPVLLHFAPNRFTESEKVLRWT